MAAVCANNGCPTIARGFYCPDCADPSWALVTAVADLFALGDDPPAEERNEQMHEVWSCFSSAEPMFGPSEHPPFYELINHDVKDC